MYVQGLESRGISTCGGYIISRNIQSLFGASAVRSCDDYMTVQLTNNLDYFMSLNSF